MSGVRNLTTREVLDLEAEGIVLEYEDEPPLDLSQIELHLETLATKQPDYSAILAAATAIKTAVEGISITVNPTDLKPILDAVRLIKREAAPVPIVPKPTVYKFEVVRDQRQLIESVIATPVNNM